MARLGRQRTMQANHIALAEYCLDGDARRGLLSPRPGKQVIAAERLGDEDFHAESSGDRRHRAPNPAKPDDAQSKTVQLDQWIVPVAPVLAPGPAAFSHCLGVLAGVLRQFE